MVNVVEDADPATVSDENALYVWPDITGPAWGTLATFKQRPEATKGIASVGDWMNTIEGAKRDAERAKVPTVYVMRNA